MTFVFPLDYDEADCVLVGVPRSFVPIVGALLAYAEKRYVWASRDDWLQGYQVITAIEECLKMGVCTQAMMDVQQEIAAMIALHLRLGNLSQAELDGIGLNYTGEKLAAIKLADVGGLLTNEENMAVAEPYLREMAEMFGAIS